MLVYKQKQYVYVLNRHGKPLMPCSPKKARLLLEQQKAKVVQRTPFTIQLLYGSSGYKQPITLGMDSGYEHVGVSVTTETQEVFAADVSLRTDVSKLITERRMYRRTRRSRQTRYRKCRFLNRVAKFKRNPLAPSIQHKLDSHIRIVQKVMSILPVTRIVVEVANFDIQKLKNPNIQGVEYQQGDRLGYENSRAYALHRDGHKCQGTSVKHHKVLNTHHIIPRSQGGSDRPENLVTLCDVCHNKFHQGKLQLDFKVPKSFKAETFMSIVRKRLVSKLQEIHNNVSITYGYITKVVRDVLGLVKSHINDAYAIAFVTGVVGNHSQSRCEQLIAEPKRRNNRSLQLNRKGFRPAVRTSHYSYRPKDNVFIKGLWYVVKGVHCKGSRIQVFNKLGKIKGFATKLIEQHYYQNGWRFSYGT